MRPPSLEHGQKRGIDKRPGTHPIKKVIGFTDEMIEAVEKWRAKQKPVPNLSEAIRRLVEIGLKEKK